MAELKVEVCKIGAIKDHPNADKLELAYIGGENGWQSCVQIGIHKVGDKVVYIPVDSILPMDVEKILFGEDSKITLKKSRVRSIKIRGAMSQGMMVSLENLGIVPNTKVGTDVAKKLGIEKYTPPVKGQPSQMQATKHRHKNPNFRKYTEINHFKYYSNALDDLDIVVTEKIHGTNFRSGHVKFNAYNIWNKFLHTIGKSFNKWQYEFAYGSHNVQLTNKGKRNKTFYGKNVYYKIAEQYDLKNILKNGEVIYAEIYGSGIQKGYTYGCKDNEHRMAVMDVMIDGKYLDYLDAVRFCDYRNLPIVPELYFGKYDYEIVNKFANSKHSFLDPKTKPIEGIVIKPVIDTKGYMGRMIFKWIGDKYWLNKGNTDWK
jgi:RNA ligase (TIGR02306 family)